MKKVKEQPVKPTLPPVEAKKVVQLPVEVLNGVLEYLGSQTFNDVANLIEAIKKTAEVVEVEE